MSLDIELTGIEDIQKALLSIGNKAKEVEETSLNKGAEVILNTAKNNLSTVAKKRTGKLEENLGISKVKRRKGQKYILVGLEPDDTSEIFYGKFLEWGAMPHTIRIRKGKSAGRTIHLPGISPRPFLAPAYESKKEEVKKIIANEFRKALGL